MTLFYPLFRQINALSNLKLTLSAELDAANHNHPLFTKQLRGFIVFAIKKVELFDAGLSCRMILQANAAARGHFEAATCKLDVTLRECQPSCSL